MTKEKEQELSCRLRYSYLLMVCVHLGYHEYTRTHLSVIWCVCVLDSGDYVAVNCVIDISNHV